MPNIKSAKKRVITSAKKCDQNTVVTSSMRTAIKKCEKAIAANDKDKAQENLNVAIKRIDKAVASGLVHKNKAAREKSRLTKKKNEME
ncbi:MAG: 30S ribosomal protein S20 [Firmicutes bacterium]|nr:30S ribosomal protein S20 [Bacillota bacterium]